MVDLEAALGDVLSLEEPTVPTATTIGLAVGELDRRGDLFMDELRRLAFADPAIAGALLSSANVADGAPVLSLPAAEERIGAATFLRIVLIQRFPDIVDPLRDARLCMTSVVELAKVLTPENRDDVLPRFFHLSKSGAKAVSAALRPAEAAPHRAVVTVARPKAPAPVLAAAAAGHPVLESPFRLDGAPGEAWRRRMSCS